MRILLCVFNYKSILKIMLNNKGVFSTEMQHCSEHVLRLQHWNHVSVGKMRMSSFTRESLRVDGQIEELFRANSGKKSKKEL